MAYNASSVPLFASFNGRIFVLAHNFDAGAYEIEIEWPSGTRQRLTNVKANQVLTIEER